MRRSCRHLLLLAAAVLAAGCAAVVPPPKTQLEVREIQTRSFDTPDTKLVMKAMLDVLQDDGYVVKNAVVDLGLITAAKEIDLAPGDYNGAVFVGPGWASFGLQTAPVYRQTEVRDFTGNISEFGEQTKVRVSFQRKVLDNHGGILEVEPIQDPAFYRDFFARVDKSVYLQKERL